MMILGMERDQGANNYYRIVQPLYKLRQHGLADTLTINPENAADQQFVTDKILEADLIVAQRPSSAEWHNLVKIIKKSGKAFIADFDDDPFTSSPWNPSYRWYGTEESTHIGKNGKIVPLWRDGERGFSIEENIHRRDYFQASFRLADAISCTTDILKKRYDNFNKNVFVLPNMVDFSQYPKVDMLKREIRIGWQGGVSHYEDLYLIVDEIKRVLKRYRNVKFVYFGDHRFKELFKNIPDNQVELADWINYSAYPYKLACLNLDIGICPLADTAFNRNKSAIKYFEYSVLKIPTIASNIPPYSKVITDGENGLLVNNDEEGAWFSAIRKLVGCRNLRKKFAKNAYENIYHNYNIDKHIGKWADAYGKLLQRPITEVMEDNHGGQGENDRKLS